MHDDAFRQSSGWEQVGVLPLTQEEATARTETFRQDAVSGELFVYWVDAATGEWGERPAAYKDVRHMERASVWDPEHVQERLRDHLSGRPSRWVEPPVPPDQH